VENDQSRGNHDMQDEKDEHGFGDTTHFSNK
jgi:hypothetical protein